MSDASGFGVRVIEVEGETVVEVWGEVDLHARDELVAAIRQGSTADRRLVVDLSRATFMDSTGLKALLDALRAQTEAGQELLLRKPAAVVMYTLEIAGLADMFRVDLTERPDP